jgi:hypothetical protein
MCCLRRLLPLFAGDTESPTANENSAYLSCGYPNFVFEFQFKRFHGQGNIIIQKAGDQATAMPGREVVHLREGEFLIHLGSAQ